MAMQIVLNTRSGEPALEILDATIVLPYHGYNICIENHGEQINVRRDTDPLDGPVAWDISTECGPLMDCLKDTMLYIDGANINDECEKTKSSMAAALDMLSFCRFERSYLQDALDEFHGIENRVLANMRDMIGHSLVNEQTELEDPTDRLVRRREDTKRFFQYKAAEAAAEEES